MRSADSHRGWGNCVDRIGAAQRLTQVSSVKLCSTDSATISLPIICAKDDCLRLPTAVGLSCLLVIPAIAADPKIERRESLDATLWIQQSFEYRYGAEQTFRSARSKLSDALKHGTASVEQIRSPRPFGELPPAIVFDLDETLLDNSAYQGWQVSKGKSFTHPTWDEWVAQGKAGAVPGALGFAREAHERGIKLFFVSNRECKPEFPADRPLAERCPQKMYTMQNMRELGFPQSDMEESFLFAKESGWDNDKQWRRAKIAQSYRIIMLLGDDLGDFIPLSYLEMLRKGEDKDAYARYLQYFGERWFVIANPMYGSWERALMHGVCAKDEAPETCEKKKLTKKYELIRAAEIAGNATRSPLTPSTLKLATWNLEWFMTAPVFDQLTPTCFGAEGNPPGNVRAIPCNIIEPVSKRRSEGDLAKLREYVKRLNADVVSLQEVDGPEAAATLFADYDFCFTKRSHVQNVGIAIKKGIAFQCNADVIELGLPEDRVRWGADVTLFPNSPQSIRLLGIHLKSGCNSQALNGTREDCKLLATQVPVLEQWIDARARDGAAFAVIGDFNRKLNDDFKPARDASGKLQSFWNELDDADPPGLELTNLTSKLPFKNCSKRQQFNAYVDDIVMSKAMTARMVPGSAERLVFDDADAEQFRLSDHCPIAVTIKLSSPAD